MTQRPEVDLRDVARVIGSGTGAYLLVHYLLLPQLVHWGVSFPAYFYIGVVATGVLSVLLCGVIRAPWRRAEGHDGRYTRHMPIRMRGSI